MKFLQIVFSVLILNYVCAVDYCHLEREKCSRYSTHVLCPRNNFHLIENFESVEVTDEDRTKAVADFNSFKNSFAGGDKRYIPSASRLSVIKWSTELENIAKTAVKVQDSYEYIPCFSSESSKNIKAFSHSTTFEITENVVIPNAIGWYALSEFEGKGEKEENKVDDKKWFASKLAQTTEIGCALGLKHTDYDQKKWIVKCLYNVGDEQLTSYAQGQAASRCGDIRQRRSYTYPALCE